MELGLQSGLLGWVEWNTGFITPISTASLGPHVLVVADMGDDYIYEILATEGDAVVWKGGGRGWGAVPLCHKVSRTLRLESSLSCCPAFLRAPQQLTLSFSALFFNLILQPYPSPQV